MRRKIISGISFILIAITFNACESLGTCKVCRQVTYEIGGGVIDPGTDTEYCDAALIAIQAKKDVIVGNTRLTWECR